jgi:hypothetical protein
MRVEPSDKGPARKVYWISEKGRRNLQKWLDGPETKEYELLLKMCFGSMIRPGLMEEKLKAYAEKRDNDIALMEEFMKGFGGGQEYGPNALYYLLITELGLAYFKEERAWCSRSIGRLRRDAGDIPAFPGDVDACDVKGSAGRLIDHR